MPSTSSRAEAACPACQRPLKDAVTPSCGHTFCPRCLPPSYYMGAQHSGRVLLCPLCKEEEKTETFVAPVPLGPLGETYCAEHGEKIYFFCENDTEFLCVLCREGPAHQAHAVGFLDSAIQPYRDRLRSRLEALRGERDAMEDVKGRADQKLHVLLSQIESRKQQVEAAFERLQQGLREQQCFLLARLSELQQQVWEERDKYISTVTEEVARLGTQVKELEEKCQWPANELLQDVRVSQSRCEIKTFVSPEAISPELVKKIRDLHRKILTLPELMSTFSENLVCHLETDSGIVTLDPQTASRSLVFAADRKSVRCTRHKQSLPNPPPPPPRSQSLSASPQGATAGRWQCSWGAALSGGVAMEAVKRSGEQGLGSAQGVWAVVISHRKC
uniref:Tripartite motif containing 15 n=1 Tax=Molossus molossus TaxID=27622 RepID=A0A7J8GTM1_MOLMO|nr:tripartite motif containing 15 [Molossus molossus]